MLMVRVRVINRFDALHNWDHQTPECDDQCARLLAMYVCLPGGIGIGQTSSIPWRTTLDECMQMNIDIEFSQ